MSDEMGIYINRCRIYINLMIFNQQWSGISKADVDNWISNFVDMTSEEIGLIYKILTNLIYFSEKDVENILKDGVYNHLYGKLILQKQIDCKFQLSSKALSNIVQEGIEKTCFIPLLDMDAPHESGNYVSRLLVQKGIIQTHQSLFSQDIINAIKKYGFTRIVIVDDCVGSGDQLKKFWNINANVDIEGKKILLKEWCISENIEVDYLVLFGYDKNIQKLQYELTDINIHCVKTLNDIHLVLNENSYIWDNKEEFDLAYLLLERISKEKGIELYGYSGLSFPFIMHQTIPDWSLPILWRETPDWKCLLRRKNSNV